MHLAQRSINVLSIYVALALFHTLHRPWSQKVLKNHLGVGVSIDEFASSASLVLVNTHWSVFGARSVVPTVLEVGGMHITPSTFLPKVSIFIAQYFKKFLEKYHAH